MFKPQSDYILIKPIERKLSSTLAIIAEPEYSRGLVVAVGPGERMKRKNGTETGFIRPCGVKVGDFITYGLDWIYPKYEENGVEYRILQDKDVLFISDRESVDIHNSLSDEQIKELIASHNKELRYAA
jgi:co-chaperonin GroES (HSP10)